VSVSFPEGMHSSEKERRPRTCAADNMNRRKIQMIIMITYCVLDAYNILLPLLTL